MAYMKQFKKGYSYITLYNDKIDDLSNLIIMRNYSFQLDEANYLFRVFFVLFLKLNNNDTITSIAKAKNRLFSTYARFSEVDDSFIDIIADFNYRDFTTRNEELIKNLNITKDEQKNLKVIIEKSEKNRRSYIKRKDKNMLQKNIDDDSFIEMYQKLISSELPMIQIAERLGISIRTLYRKLKKLNVK